MTSKSPHRATLRSYQIGFGDCYLLSFHYPGKGARETSRHVLIDFGTTVLPDGAPKNLRLLVAQDIQKQCKDELDVVVATHRHSDHINGFATGKGGYGEVIAALNPKAVLQPWTEHPEAASDSVTGAVSHSLAPRRKFLGALNAMQDIAFLALKEINEPKARIGRSQKIAEQLHFLSLVNFKDPANLSAIKNLQNMGKNGRAHYLAYGDPLDLNDVLPGVKVRVLGPPTIEQSAGAIKQQRSEDPDEFWFKSRDWADKFEKFHEASEPAFWQLRFASGFEFWRRQADLARDNRRRDALLFANGAPLATSALTPPHTRWFVRRMNSVRSDQLLGMVRILDNALNNTSLILLFEFGNKKLLFPGDAQIENWSYALKYAPDKESNLALLRGVNLYKVGHHGSRNATPKTLWKILTDDGKRPKETLHSVVSTKADVHGDPLKKTEVPREDLIKEFRRFEYFSTQELGWNDQTGGQVLFKEFEFRAV